MAEDKRDECSPEQAKGSQEERQQGKPWTLKEIWGRPVWDWMELLVVPFIVSIATVVFTFLFTQQQNFEERQAQLSLENQRADFSVYQEYLSKIETLLLDGKLRTSVENSDVQLVARARTLAALDALSQERKVLLLEFLFETQLIQFGPQGAPPVISLKFADLSGTRLVERSILSNTDLDRAELSEANLENADLRNTELPRADLSSANLTGANLSGANLWGADLSGAKGVRCQQTQSAESLEGATMPNGRKYEDWLKDREGCRE